MLERQWEGSEEHKTQGLPVRTSSPPIPGKLKGGAEVTGVGADVDVEDPQPVDVEDEGLLAVLLLIPVIEVIMEN